MNCKQATRLLSERMDRPLTTKEKLALRMHTTICSGCRQFGIHMEDLRFYSKHYMKIEIKNKEN